MTRTLAVLAMIALAGPAAAEGLTLSPAVVPLGGKPGQSTQQRLTLFNGTSHDLAFRLVAKDVVVVNGERVFADAGTQPGSIAATAVFSAPAVSLHPNEERSVDVTLTLPANVANRAVVILFQGTTKIDGRATVSIGSLLTFELAGRRSIAPGDLRASPPTPSANAMVSVPLANDGTEPALVRGAIAILDGKGALVGKLGLEPRRLLPGEHGALRSDYGGNLAPGTYRVVATIESFKRSWTRMTKLEVP